MAEFPYIQNTARIRAFFKKIGATAVPDKVTHKHLQGLGFTSTNDRPLISILRSLGFLDASSVPTDRWHLHRDSARAKAVMAEAIKDAYEDFFAVYTDAYARDAEDLRNVVKSKTNLSDSTIEFVVRTFKTLCDLADFEAPAPERRERPRAGEVAPVGDRSVQVAPAAAAPTIAISIQLQLPATEDPSIYENIFAALKKHLFP